MAHRVTLPPGAAEFLDRSGWQAATVSEFSADAAFRRYFRLVEGDSSRILMFAPDPSERSEWFVALASHMKDCGVSAPEIFAHDLDQGFILLEDFGSRQFYQHLPELADEVPLYEAATDVLAKLHAEPMPKHIGQTKIPRFSHKRMRTQVGYFLEWHWPEVAGVPAGRSLEKSFKKAWKEVLPHADYADDRLVQYDYHSPNLMWLPDRAGIERVGILDFQDAMRGPAAYDLVSLLQDARRDVAEGLEDAMVARYLAQMPAFDARRFRTSYAVMGAQRATRILGVFVRLWRRDGKPGYLHHIPRLWRQLDDNLCHPALRPVAEWFETHLPARERVDFGDIQS